MNTQKSFATVYDKDCEEYAVTLMALVSKDATICNINQKTEEFKKNREIVSGEYVLTIGNKGSEYYGRNFKDIYNNYGIHFGYYGTKGWIYCEKFKWSLIDQANFVIELHSTRERLGLSIKNYEKYVKTGLQYKQLEDDSSALKEKAIEYAKSIGGVTKWDELKQYNPELANQITNNTNKTVSLLREAAYESSWISDLSGSEMRKLQYRFAVELFYDKYIHNFLGIRKEGNDETYEGENLEENF